VNGPFVADASVAIAWIHPAQATAETQAILRSVRAGAVLHVPALWPLEVANALLVLTRRRKLSEAERRAALGWIQGLSFEIDHEMSGIAFHRLSDLASEHGLSLYDAVYLELAERRCLPLACKDGPLRDAAAKQGVVTWR
jgi:predicted nucleic acid-binding protein